MVTLRKSDFYHGSLISDLLNNRKSPILIERNGSRWLYKCTTDSGEFSLFMKTTSGQTMTRSNLRSWRFAFADQEILELNASRTDPTRNMMLALICGNDEMAKTTYALLTREDVNWILDREIIRFTISIRPGESCFRVGLRSRRENALRVPARRRISELS